MPVIDQKLETTVHLPSLGESVEEATVTRWLKQPGERVEQEEPLLEIATDKVDTEIVAPCSGTLTRILAQENDTVPVGAGLAVITAEAHADAAPEAIADAVERPAAQPDRAVDAAAAPEPPPPPADPEHTPPAVQTSEQVPPSVASAGSGANGPTTEKLTPVRRTIARRMLESLQISAQLTTVLEVDLTAVSRLRTAHKDDFLHRTGVKLSFLPFFAKAALEALPQHRMLNASLNTEVTEVTYYSECHLGIAVEGPKGLVVPVIRNADGLGITQLAGAIAEAANKVRTGTIAVDELNGGTFTITNTGSRGALFDTPIINQPQTGILGTGAVIERLVPIRDGNDALRIEVRPMAYLSISYDHRIVDGADAAKFLSTVKQRLEKGFTSADLGD